MLFVLHIIIKKDKCNPSILKDDVSSRTGTSIFTSIAPVLLDWSNETSWAFPALKSASHFLFQSTVSFRSDSSSFSQNVHLWGGGILFFSYPINSIFQWQYGFIRFMFLMKHFSFWLWEWLWSSNLSGLWQTTISSCP